VSKPEFDLSKSGAISRDGGCRKPTGLGWDNTNYMMLNCFFRNGNKIADEKEELLKRKDRIRERVILYLLRYCSSRV